MAPNLQLSRESRVWLPFCKYRASPACSILRAANGELWVPMVREIDVLLVNGGDALYLCYWMRQSGLADLLLSLDAV